MRAAIVLMLSGVCAACGSLVAPAGPRPVVAPQASEAAELSAVEGRPSGVVLRLRAQTDADQVVLFRAERGGEPQVLQAIPLRPETRAMLATGIEVVDSTIGVGRAEYQLALVDPAGAVVGRSGLISVNWEPPPPRPSDVGAAAGFPDAVEVSWTAPPAFGAAVFRRDVLTPGARFERVAEVAPHARVWVDRDVTAAGVWSYRISLTRRAADGFVQLGPPSEEAYASTPEAP